MAATLIIFSAPGLYAVYFEREDPALARRYEAIGRLVGHGARVLAVSDAYAFPLMYHGWLLTQPWPSEVDIVYENLRTGTVLSTEQRFHKLMQEWKPSYFVVTDSTEMARHPDLMKILERYPVVLAQHGVVVSDLRHPLPPK
jgi:hypothetical protein